MQRENDAPPPSTAVPAGRLFSVGRYEDLIAVDSDRLRFRERTVVVDTYAIPNLLATPI